MSVINRERAIEQINEQKRMYSGDKDEAIVFWVLDMAIEILENLDKPVGVNNYERIRAMTVDEMAKLLAGQCTACALQFPPCCEMPCEEGTRAWLLQECDEDADS